MGILSRKRILVLTEHFAPAYKAGGIVRSLENLVTLFDEEFEFRILSGNTNLCKKEKLTGIAVNEWRSFGKNSKTIYLSAQKQKAGVLKKIFNTVHPDVIYINGMYSFFFTILPLLLLKVRYKKIPVVLAPNGMLHSGAISNKPIKKNIYLRLFQFFGFHKEIKWHATDWQEKEDIHRFFGLQSKVLVVPPVVPKQAMPCMNFIKKESGHVKLVLLSVIAEKKGHFRLLRLLQKLPKEYRIELHLYGPVKDKAVWTACQQEIEALPDSIKVSYHGFAEPQSVSLVLQKHHFFVLLTQGENFCQAAYESLSAGRPLIISDQTPWRDLQKQKAGWDISLNDHRTLIDVFAQACLMDQSTFNDYCKGARYKAEHFIAESSYAKQYTALFG